MRYRLPIVKVEWDENPFEWTYPYRFGIVRSYRTGPLAEMRVLCEMTPAAAGTKLIYQVWAKPANIIGYPAISIGIGLFSAQIFIRALHRCDALAASGKTILDAPGTARLASGGIQRLDSVRARLTELGGDPALISRLTNLIATADDLSLTRMRPFALADYWNKPRRATLEMFLQATRLGALDIRWELICPMCRGASESVSSLSEVHSESHCDSCQMDFETNFDRQVEVVFRPNEAVRAISSDLMFCVGNPQRQSHVNIAHTVPPHAEITISTMLAAGRYDLQTSTGSLSLHAKPNGPNQLTVRSDQTSGENEIGLMPIFRLINESDSPFDIFLKQSGWSDQAATAADVTSLQMFRDLFASEALRPGEELSVGSVTIMFTDLRNSTKLYLQIGDAPAFGRVRDHFEILEQAIAAEGGAVVKTMGDAVMAVFRQPAAALKAVWGVQALLAQRSDPALWLKVGIHHGACIAVNLNDRLDYFGSTVNIAARLPGISQGGEVILSDSVYADGEVHAFLDQHGNEKEITPFKTSIKGFDQPFDLWRIRL
jgi:class 3 adenylate cyclase